LVVEGVGAPHPANFAGRKRVPNILDEFGITPERIDDNQRAIADVVARYYGDPDFKAQVDADPTAVLKAEGVEIPDGATVKLLFNSETVWHLVVPDRAVVDSFSRAADPASED
jgi:hypothetical protein